MNCCCCRSTASASSSRRDNIDNDNDLSKPLLLLLEDDTDGSSSSSSPPFSSLSSLESWCDSFLAWFVLPCLLWLDFWLVLHNNNSNNSSNYSNYSNNNSSAASSAVQVQAVSMASVHLSFAMFIVASFLYRKTLEEHDCQSILLLLVPEIAMNAMLLLIFVNQTFAAYLTLLGVILALSSVVVAVSAFRLGCVHEIVDGAGSTATTPLLQEDDDDDVDVEEGRAVVVKPTASIRR
jgi:hypothetical protein